MTETFWTHLSIAAAIFFPLASGIGYIIWQQAQMAVKVEAMWQWYSNDAHELTGYKPGDERKR